jgi:hypothetical protein
MERVLVINGCSHTAGSEIDGPGIGDSPSCRSLSFGNLVAERMGRTAINMAYPGGSNDRICRSSMSWIADNIEKILNKELDVFFLIHWTSSERADYHFSQQNFGDPDLLKIKFSSYCEDPYYKSFTSQSPIPETGRIGIQDVAKAYKTLFINSFETWSDNKIKNIISLQGILKQFNIPYWFGDSFYFDYCNTPTFQKLTKLIDTKYFPYYNCKDMSYYWMCSNAGFKNQDSTNRLWHLGKDAHKFYANWLINEISREDYGFPI